MVVVLEVNLQLYGQSQICHYLFLIKYFDSFSYSNHSLQEENIDCKAYCKILIKCCFKILIVDFVINQIVNLHTIRGLYFDLIEMTVIDS